MFHNPKALVPVPADLFPGIAHHHLDELHRMRSVVPAFHPYGSITQVFNGVPDPTVCPPVSPAVMQMFRGKVPVGGKGGPKKVPAGVRRISRAEFQSYELAHGPVMAPAMERSWFADDKGLLGTVFRDMSENDWNFVVLAPDSEGVYRWVAGNGCMDTQEEAEQSLTAEMSNL
jgi:hypothetical protein